MREIKFRLWDKNYRIMDYEFSKVNLITHDGKVLERYERTFADQYWYEYDEVNHFELMQYTGLKDKNGKEIYEGDIVEFIMPDIPFVIQGNGYSDVAVHEGFKVRGVVRFLYSCWLIDEGEGKGCPLEFDENQQIEVIDNIYENPSLLEVSHD